MKKLFIPVLKKTKFNSDEFSKEIKNQRLPKELFLAYSIQFKELANQAEKFLKQNNFKIIGKTQVLGCSKLQFSKKPKAILLFGEGKFHATGIALETEIPVYIFEGNKIKKISEKEINDLKRKKKTALLKFLHSKKVGVLISTKPGQNRLTQTLKLNLQKKYSNKEFYFFISNELNLAERENFPDIESWINTACPRMDMNDFTILNIGDLND